MEIDNGLFKKIILIVFIVFFCNINETEGQDLVRKGSLGAELENISIGIRINKVFKNTTADNLGLIEGDIIKSINKTNYSSVSNLIKYIRTWSEGDFLSIKVTREGENTKLAGSVIGKPKEVSPNGINIYGCVDYDGGKLRTILTLPKNVDNPPVIYFLQGVGCASIDFYNNPSSTVKLLIDAFVEKGIAVFRIEKPGMGDSVNTKDCLEMDYDYELKAFDEGLKKLSQNKKVDVTRIFLFGESLSSITAPILAENYDVKGIINWGGIAGTWFDYYMSIQINQKKLMGQSDSIIKKNYDKLLPFYKDYLINNLSPVELKNKGYNELVNRYFASDSTWAGLHHYTYFQKLNKRNSLESYKGINCKVLNLAGGHDIHTANTKWAIDIANAVNIGERKLGSYVIMPNTTHHYFKVKSIDEYNKLRRTNEITSDFMKEHFDFEIANKVSTWIQEIK